MRPGASTPHRIVSMRVTVATGAPHPRVPSCRARHAARQMTSLYFVAYAEPDRTRWFHARGVALIVASHALNSSQPEGSGEVSARDAAMLAFERQWWKYAGAKAQAVREAVARQWVVGRRLGRVDEGVQLLVVARRGHVELLADGLLLGAGVL